MHHDYPRRLRTDIDNCGNVLSLNTGGAAHYHFERSKRCVGFNVHYGRFQAGCLGDRDPILDFFFARGGDENFNFIFTIWRRPNDLKIEIYFVQTKRDVLIGLRLNLILHVLFALIAAKVDLFGYHGSRRQRQSDILDARRHLFMRTSHHFTCCFDIGDVTVGNRILRQRFNDVPLYSVESFTRFRQFHHLNVGRTDVDPDERLRCRAQKIKLGCQLFFQHGG